MLIIHAMYFFLAEKLKYFIYLFFITFLSFESALITKKKVNRFICGVKFFAKRKACNNTLGEVNYNIT